MLEEIYVLILIQFRALEKTRGKEEGASKRGEKSRWLLEIYSTYIIDRSRSESHRVLIANQDTTVLLLYLLVSLIFIKAWILAKC